MHFSWHLFICDTQCACDFIIIIIIIIIIIYLFIYLFIYFSSSDWTGNSEIVSSR